MHTVTISLPARAHLASVPPTVNSWSSGCAWMLITRLGAGGSRRAAFAGLARSGTPGVADSASGSWAAIDSGSRSATDGSGRDRGQTGQLRLDLRLGDGTDDLIRDLAILDEQDGRDGANAVARREGGLLVHIHFGQRHSALRRLRQLFEHRGDGSAGATPRRPEIHHPYTLGRGQRLIEGLLGEMHDARLGAGVFLLGAHCKSLLPLRCVKSCKGCAPTRSGGPRMADIMVEVRQFDKSALPLSVRRAMAGPRGRDSS